MGSEGGMGEGEREGEREREREREKREGERKEERCTLNTEGFGVHGWVMLAIK